MNDAMRPTPTGSGACPDFEVLSCYADGELAPERAAELGEHVSACGHCATLAVRLRDGFEASEARRDGGIGGSGCADEEALVLYAGGRLAAVERGVLDAHLESCDACVRAVVLVHRRLSLASDISIQIPSAVRLRADAAIEAAARSLAPARPPSRAPFERQRPGFLERLSAWLRIPVLVPAAVAVGALLAVLVLPHGAQPPTGERSRAIAPGSSALRVTAVEAPVRARPSMQSPVVATVKRGTVLEVAGEERDWYQVQLEGGTPGWVAREAFE